MSSRISGAIQFIDPVGGDSLGQCTMLHSSILTHCRPGDILGGTHHHSGNTEVPNGKGHVVLQENVAGL